MSQGDDAERSGTNRRGPPALDPLQDEALKWLLELQAADDEPAVRRAFDAWLAKRGHAFETVITIGAPEVPCSDRRSRRMTVLTAS